MIVSYNWLQKYFKDPLPSVDRLADTLTFGVAEIEGIEKKGSDTVIDVKVLPDRACYMLSHRGIAKEISTLLSLPLEKDPLHTEAPSFSPLSNEIKLSVNDAKANPVHVLALIKGVKVGPSPVWLKDALETLGQRSINNVVDATNYVLLDIGQPTHAFDWEKLSEESGTRGIRVRPSQEEEKITLLGGNELTLPGGVQMLCDIHNDTPLDIAGIKGGTHAELTEVTQQVLITAAQFDPTLIRKTATRLGIKTDAVKRFENGVPSELPLYGMRAVVALIQEVAGGEVVDQQAIIAPAKLPYMIGVSPEEVNSVLGVALSHTDIQTLLSKFSFDWKEITNPRTRVLELAHTLIGAEYKADSSFRVDAPHKFSCSSLTNYLFVQAGIAMPSVSVDQYVWGDPIEKEALQEGDLVFSNSGKGKIWTATHQFLSGTPVPEGVDHVGLYIGNGQVLHATRDPGKVIVEEVETSPSFKNIVGYRRAIKSNEERILVTVPFERLDVRTKEDLIEEIGRVYGYEKIQGTLLRPTISARVLKERYWSEVVRSALTDLGFKEVMTYSLSEKGEARLANPLAADKGFLRGSLKEGLKTALDKNEYNLPLTGEDEVKIFEIGTVFGHDEESLHIGIAARSKAGKKREERTSDLLQQTKDALLTVFARDDLQHINSEEVLEINLSHLMDELSDAKEYPAYPRVIPSISYTPLSVYPFVLRDIALWAPKDTTADQVAETIKAHAGTELVRIDLFDSFVKEERISYAFHLVFQSSERTLSDSEVTQWMDKITTAVQEKGWEVR